MAGFLPTLQPIALAADLYDVCVMQEPIEQCRGERGVVGERGCPLLKVRLLVTMVLARS
jgi:hypothetical protein